MFFHASAAFHPLQIRLRFGALPEELVTLLRRGPTLRAVAC